MPEVCKEIAKFHTIHLLPGTSHSRVEQKLFEIRGYKHFKYLLPSQAEKHITQEYKMPTKMTIYFSVEKPCPIILQLNSIIAHLRDYFICGSYCEF